MKHNKRWLGAAGLAGIAVGILLGGATGSDDSKENVLTFGDITVTKDDFYEMLRDEPYMEGFTFGQAMMEKIVLEEALEKRYGHLVTEEKVADEIERLKLGFDSEEDFLQNLEDNGATVESFAKDLRFSGLVNEALYEFHPIDEAVVEEQYENMVPVGMRIAHILVKEEDEAREALKRYEAGESFADLVKEYSLDEKSKEEGGEYTLIHRYFVPEFEEAALALAENEYTKEPLKTEYGYHIILKVSAGIKLSYEEEKEGIVASQYQLLMEQDPAFFDKIMNRVTQEYEEEVDIRDHTMTDLISHTTTLIEEQEKEREKRNREYEELRKTEPVEEYFFPAEGLSNDGYAFTDMIEGNRMESNFDFAE